MTALNRYMERLAHRTTVWTGTSWAFIVALCMTLAWLASGPVFGFSDTWQLVMNTVSSIVTLLMVFLLQRSQNKGSLAMQIKLNELVAALPRASNRLINVEELPEADVRELHAYYQKLRLRAQARGKVNGACSIEQALRVVERKDAGAAPRRRLGPATRRNPNDHAESPARGRPPAAGRRGAAGRVRPPAAGRS
jgi:low affinity Fe/Cu permease